MVLKASKDIGEAITKLALATGIPATIIPTRAFKKYHILLMVEALYRNNNLSECMQILNQYLRHVRYPCYAMYVINQYLAISINYSLDTFKSSLENIIKYNEYSIYVCKDTIGSTGNLDYDHLIYLKHIDYGYHYILIKYKYIIEGYEYMQKSMIGDSLSGIYSLAHKINNYLNNLFDFDLFVLLYALNTQYKLDLSFTYKYNYSMCKCISDVISMFAYNEIDVSLKYEYIWSNITTKSILIENYVTNRIIDSNPECRKLLEYICERKRIFELKNILKDNYISNTEVNNRYKGDKKGTDWWKRAINRNTCLEETQSDHTSEEKDLQRVLDLMDTDQKEEHSPNLI
ncbi:hypothetical protein NEOKW01_1995 [Nematocida sp. AWRm80]|nr:hypothetical protein NEOKW01_1995 [Nematocida sp. AWRm80]